MDLVCSSWSCERIDNNNFKVTYKLYSNIVINEVWTKKMVIDYLNDK